MSYDPSHQSISPSFAGTNSDAVSAASVSTNSIRAGVPSGSERPAQASASKKRRSSKMKPSKQLPRSASTPQMRDIIMSEEDKKRNKLGYQRISIACGKSLSSCYSCDHLVS